MKWLRFGNQPPPPDDADLLDRLFQNAPPPAQLSRGPRLRTVAQERQRAFQPFRLRSWVDLALHHLERLLVIAACASFAFWFAEGYGRDLLYQYEQQRPLAGLVRTLPALQAHAAWRTAQASALAAPAAAALPFTTPEMALAVSNTPQARPPSGDFMAPDRAPAAAPLLAIDPRPQRLAIPAIGLESAVREVFVVDGVWQVADYAAGYHHGSALPGQAGNLVMAGHAGLRGAVFRDLPALRVGDQILVESATWRYLYVVREQRRVWPTDVAVMDPTPSATLTLITCTDWDTRRLVVVADLVDARPLD